MNYAELFTQAISALKGNFLRTALTMLGIVIGITSVILIISLGNGATASITNQVSSFGTNLIFIAPGSRQPGRTTPTNTLKYADVQAITNNAKNLGVTAVSAIVSTAAEVVANRQNNNTSIQGVGSDYAVTNSIDMDQGEFISPEDENGFARVAVLGPQESPEFR